MVDDGEDRVVSIRLRESDNEVHGYLLERKGGWVRGDFVHRRARAVGDDFVLLALRASLDVVRDPDAHVWPPVVSLRLGDGFVTSGVSSYQAFVDYSHDFPFDRQVRGDSQLPVLPPTCDFCLRGSQEGDRSNPVSTFPVFHERSVFTLEGGYFFVQCSVDGVDVEDS